MLDNPPESVAISLARHESLRQEMSQRAGNQQTILGLNLTAVGALAGVVVANKASAELLLVIPFVSSTLGLLWLDHHIAIHRLGKVMAKNQPWATRQPDLPHPLPPGWGWIYWSCMGLVFGAAGLGGLLLGWPRSPASAAAWSAVAIGAALELLFLFAFVHQAAESLRQSRSEDLARTERPEDCLAWMTPLECRLRPSRSRITRVGAAVVRLTVAAGSRVGAALPPPLPDLPQEELSDIGCTHVYDRGTG